MMRSGRGAGKLILFGEHAAVYGSPAVGTQLPFVNRLSWREGMREDGPEDGTGKAAAAAAFPDDNPKERRLMRDLLEDAAGIGGVEVPEGGVWNRRSTIPRCGGFGSSAALCTALARILLNRDEGGYSREVHRLANRLEARFHGTPSGIDTGLSSHPGTTAWIARKGDVPEARALNFPRLYLIYGALPRRADTSFSVARLRRERKMSEGVIRKFEEIAEGCSNFIDQAEEGYGKADDFHSRTAYLVNRARELLASLELSVPALEWILDAALRLGMSAGKLSGAGLGGAFFLCSAHQSVRDRVLIELTSEVDTRGIELAEPLRPLDIGGKTDSPGPGA